MAFVHRSLSSSLSRAPPGGMFRPMARPVQFSRTAVPEAAQDVVQQQVSVLQGLSEWSAANLPRYSSPAQQQQQQWQPSDFLPDPSSEDFLEELEMLAEEARSLPHDVLAVLAGLAVNASCLPNQQSLWCATPVLGDASGADQHSWARWRRGATADRNRSRQLLLSYLSLSGCIDCIALELTCQLSIAAGPAATTAAAAAAAETNYPYQQLMRGMLEARMCRVMFTNLARLCSFHEAANAANVAAAIAADEGRHELAQVAAVSQLFAADPLGAVSALAQVVQQGITLTAARMDDAGRHEALNPNSSRGSSLQQASGPDDDQQQQQQPQTNSSSSSSSGCSRLYVDFMAVADAAGVYCISDAAAAVQEACELFRVPDIAASLQRGCLGDSSSHPQPSAEAAAAEAADLLLRHSSLLARMAELQLEGRLRSRRRDRCRAVVFSWLYGKEVQLG